MADSNITKRALAAALKELMTEQPFSKIRVGDICDRCEMHRKSFYYHFKDKYELVDWIFDTEFAEKISKQEKGIHQDYFSALCNYLYDNREFYSHALKIEGQNAFSAHFHERLRQTVSQRLNNICDVNDMTEFYADFITDGMICAIERWILQKECMPPERFLNSINLCINRIAVAVTDNNSKK